MLGLLLLFALQQPPAASAAPEAALYAAALHDSMLDPASFVLDGAYVTKLSKRSHNRMGGYTEGRAVVDGDDHNRLSVYDQPSDSGHFPGYDVGWFAPCKDKNVVSDLTSQAKNGTPLLYTRSK